MTTTRDAASSPAARYPQLDALRGIAAALVVLHHAYQTWPVWPQLVRFTPARLLLNGRSSVIFFFVLSGFVLAHGLLVGRPQGYGTFVLRRIARIYLPYAVAGAIATAGALAFAHVSVPGVGVTFNEMWMAPPDGTTALGHLLLVGSPATNAVNVPSWSLVYELRIALLIPPLVFGLAVAPRATLALACGAIACAEVWLAHTEPSPVIYAATGLAENLAATLHFAGCFLVGVLLARAEAAKLPLLRAGGRVAGGMMAAAAIALMMIFRDVTCTIGSAIILVLALRWDGFIRWLSHPLLARLGQISFSLYLTHMIVVEATVRALDGTVPAPVSLALALILVLPCAVLFYGAVERPSHRLARAIAFDASAPRRFAHGRMSLRHGLGFFDKIG